MQRPDGKSELPQGSGASDTPQVAIVNFGPKYELHMAEKQKQLDSATSQYVQGPDTCLHAFVLIFSRRDAVTKGLQRAELKRCDAKKHS